MNKFGQTYCYRLYIYLELLLFFLCQGFFLGLFILLFLVTFLRTLVWFINFSSLGIRLLSVKLLLTQKSERDNREQNWLQVWALEVSPILIVGSINV